MAEYLEIALTESELQAIVEFTSFTNMKDYVKFNSPHYKPDLQFFRKGKVGDWRNYLSQEMSERMDQWIEKNLEYKGKINFG